MKTIKKILKSIAVAFSLYSLIPMPHFEWDSSDMDYHLIFFPWVGAVIGAIDLLWMQLALRLNLHDLTRILVAMAIPLLITGGFHVDGYMDTCDALKSYGSREKKLEILKDPHIGAFSVICLVIYMLLAIAGINEVWGESRLIALACVPALARAGSGLIVTYMSPAKKDGMLKTSSDNNAGKVVGPLLILTVIICMIIMCVADIITGSVIILTEVMFFLYFKHMSQEQFGGVTGDLAGFYVVMAELIAILATAICRIV